MPQQDPEPPLPGAPESPESPESTPVPASRIAAWAPQQGRVGRAYRRVRSIARMWRLYWLRVELRFVPTEPQRLFALTMIIGVTCGLAAVAFHLSIRVLELNLIGRAMEAPGRSWMLWTIVSPAIGGLVCGALLQYVVPNARGSGIPQVKAVFAIREGRLRFRDAAGKFVVGALQIGSGGSLGREGPTVHICAGIASLLGRVAGVSPKSLRRLIPVGAAAGIAAAFNAPIAAVTFTIEEVVGNLDKSVLSGVIVAAALAAVIERSVLGEHPVFNVHQGYGLHHASSLLLYAVLGVAAALASLVFTDALLSLRLRFRRMKLVPRWAQPGVGGLVTGALAVAALRWLHSGGVTGGGYDTLEGALDGKMAVQAMLVLCAMKLAATVFSYSSGGAGGIFAPSLFIGGMLGGAFGAVDVRLFGHEPDTVGSFALVGMGAVFAGIIRAPMTSVLIIVEMTGGYSLILPLMIANMTAYVLARRIRPTPVYEALLEQDGIRLYDKAVMDVLDGVPIGELFVRGAALVTFSPTLRAGELLRADRAQEVYPVLDAAGKMAGIITSEDLQVLAGEPDLELVVNASDIMRPPVSVRHHDDLRKALEVMLANELRRLPVLDDKGRIEGFVDEAAIAKVYLRRNTGGD
jgi:CIC family chloride channel protein